MILAGLSLFLILFFAGTASAQDTIKKKEVKRTVQIRIIEDEDGNITKMDTTFDVTDDISKDKNLEYHYRIKAFEDQEQMMEDQMRDVERQMRDVEFFFNDGFPHQFGMQGMFPFGNIKEYKVKETKNGKRIIIEMEDGGNNVIIMHPHGNRHMHGPRRVIIERDVQLPPPPPPPAPPAPDKG